MGKLGGTVLQPKRIKYVDKPAGSCIESPDVCPKEAVGVQPR